MLRGVVGTENFWKGIKIYYQKYRDSHATVADFRRVMEEVSGKDLSIFFEQWLYKPGTLKYEGNWRYDVNKKEIAINLTQVQMDGSLYKMPLEIEIRYPGQSKPKTETIQVDARSNVFTVKSPEQPENIILDPNMWVLMDANFKQENNLMILTHFINL